MQVFIRHHDEVFCLKNSFVSWFKKFHCKFRWKLSYDIFHLLFWLDDVFHQLHYSFTLTDRRQKGRWKKFNIKCFEFPHRLDSKKLNSYFLLSRYLRWWYKVAYKRKKAISLMLLAFLCSLTFVLERIIIGNATCACVIKINVDSNKWFL